MNKQRQRTEYFDHFLFKTSPRAEEKDSPTGKRRETECVLKRTDSRYIAYKVSTPIISQIVNGFFGFICILLVPHNANQPHEDVCFSIQTAYYAVWLSSGLAVGLNFSNVLNSSVSHSFKRASLPCL